MEANSTKQEKKLYDIDETRRALHGFFSPGEVRELKAPRDRPGVISGYFDDPKALAKEAMKCSGSFTPIVPAEAK